MNWLLRTTLWLLLGGWFGAWALFALVVAPTAFQVLPSLNAASALVGPVLAVLHNYGIGAGLGLAGLAVLLQRGPALVLLPTCLALLCAISEYGVTPAIDGVLPTTFGAQQEPDASARFTQLHQTSRLLYGSVGLGVLTLIGLHAFAESADRGRPATPERSKSSRSRP